MKGNPNCLHCLVENLIKEKTDGGTLKFTIKDIILRLNEVIADHIMHVDSMKQRAEYYEYWSNIMLELMREIESGEYK